VREGYKGNMSKWSFEEEEETSPMLFIIEGGEKEGRGLIKNLKRGGRCIPWGVCGQSGRKSWEIFKKRVCFKKSTNT